MRVHILNAYTLRSCRDHWLKNVRVLVYNMYICIYLFIYITRIIRVYEKITHHNTAVDWYRYILRILYVYHSGAAAYRVNAFTMLDRRHSWSSNITLYYNIHTSVLYSHGAVDTGSIDVNRYQVYCVPYRTGFDFFSVGFFFLRVKHSNARCMCSSIQRVRKYSFRITHLKQTRIMTVRRGDNISVYVLCVMVINVRS